MWCQVPQKFPAREQNNNTKNSIYQLVQCAQHFTQRGSLSSQHRPARKILSLLSFYQQGNE